MTVILRLLVCIVYSAKTRTVPIPAIAQMPVKVTTIDVTSGNRKEAEKEILF